MKPNQILKKKIQFFLDAPTDIADYEQEKIENIEDEDDKEALVDELTFEIGKTLLAPANNFVLNNRTAEGWTNFERAMVSQKCSAWDSLLELHGYWSASR